MQQSNGVAPDGTPLASGQAASAQQHAVPASASSQQMPMAGRAEGTAPAQQPQQHPVAPAQTTPHQGQHSMPVKQEVDVKASQGARAQQPYAVGAPGTLQHAPGLHVLQQGALNTSQTLSAASTPASTTASAHPYTAAQQAQHASAQQAQHASAPAHRYTTPSVPAPHTQLQAHPSPAGTPQAHSQQHPHASLQAQQQARLTSTPQAGQAHSSGGVHTHSSVAASQHHAAAAPSQTHAPQAGTARPPQAASSAHLYPQAHASHPAQQQQQQHHHYQHQQQLQQLQQHQAALRQQAARPAGPAAQASSAPQPAASAAPHTASAHAVRPAATGPINPHTGAHQQQHLAHGGQQVPSTVPGASTHPGQAPRPGQLPGASATALQAAVNRPQAMPRPQSAHQAAPAHTAAARPLASAPMHPSVTSGAGAPQQHHLPTAAASAAQQGAPQAGALPQQQAYRPATPLGPPGTLTAQQWAFQQHQQQQQQQHQQASRSAAAAAHHPAAAARVAPRPTAIQSELLSVMSQAKDIEKHIAECQKRIARCHQALQYKTETRHFLILWIQNVHHKAKEAKARAAEGGPVAPCVPRASMLVDEQARQLKAVTREILTEHPDQNLTPERISKEEPYKSMLQQRVFKGVTSLLLSMLQRGDSESQLLQKEFDEYRAEVQSDLAAAERQAENLSTARKTAYAKQQALMQQQHQQQLAAAAAQQQQQQQHHLHAHHLAPQQPQAHAAMRQYSGVAQQAQPGMHAALQPGTALSAGQALAMAHGQPYMGMQGAIVPGQAGQKLFQISQEERELRRRQEEEARGEKRRQKDEERRLAQLAKEEEKKQRELEKQREKEQKLEQKRLADLEREQKREAERKAKEERAAAKKQEMEQRKLKKEREKQARAAEREAKKKMDKANKAARAAGGKGGSRPSASTARAATDKKRKAPDAKSGGAGTPAKKAKQARPTEPEVEAITVDVETEQDALLESMLSAGKKHGHKAVLSDDAILNDAPLRARLLHVAAQHGVRLVHRDAVHSCSLVVELYLMKLVQDMIRFHMIAKRSAKDVPGMVKDSERNWLREISTIEELEKEAELQTRRRQQFLEDQATLASNFRRRGKEMDEGELKRLREEQNKAKQRMAQSQEVSSVNAKLEGILGSRVFGAGRKKRGRMMPLRSDKAPAIRMVQPDGAGNATAPATPGDGAAPGDADGNAADQAASGLQAPGNGATALEAAAAANGTAAGYEGVAVPVRAEGPSSRPVEVMKETLRLDDLIAALTHHPWYAHSTFLYELLQQSVGGLLN